MQCPMATREGADLVLDYCARRLEADKTAWFERHLNLCDSCRALVAAQKQVWDALDYWEALPYSDDFDRRLSWRIDAEERKPWIARVFGSDWSGWLRPALPVASVGVLALAVFLIRAPAPVETETPVRIETAEVELAERALEDLDMIRQFTLPPREGNPQNPI